MKCEWVKTNLLLYVYDELPDDARFELEQHLERCSSCAAELVSTRSFKDTLTSAAPVLEPTPNLLAGSRMRLQEALETAERPGWWHHLVFDVSHLFGRTRFSPALASVIFIVGFGAGITATYKLANDGRTSSVASLPGQQAQAQPGESSIAGIRAISQDPGSNKVEIKYDTLTTQSTQGSLNDQRIQQLLLYAARNNFNSGVRLDSVDLLTQNPDSPQTREALTYALRYDTNPGVRLKALDGLGAYVKQDVRVRNAVLEALMNDGNSGVRTLALKLLEPVSADSSVRQALLRLAREDKNQYIRSQSRSVLAQLPEID
jgi:HEAT repeats/Putative zinc-finger